jgi:hypothetical protein
MFLVLLVVFKEKFGEKMPSGANWLRHIYASDEITSLSNIHMLKADLEVASRPRMSIIMLAKNSAPTNSPTFKSVRPQVNRQPLKLSLLGRYVDMYGGTRGWCGHARCGTRCRRVQFTNFDRHTPIEGEDVFDGGGPHSLGTRHRRLGVNIGDHLLPLQLLFVGHEVEAVGKIGNHPAHG